MEINRRHDGRIEEEKKKTVLGNGRGRRGIVKFSSLLNSNVVKYALHRIRYALILLATKFPLEIGFMRGKLFSIRIVSTSLTLHNTILRVKFLPDLYIFHAITYKLVSN